MKKDTAIVIGYKGTNSTGLIRSLGEAGYHVVFASSYSRIESKYTAEYLFLPEKDEERKEVLCRFLKNLPSKAALFTGDDASNAFITKYYDLISPYCYCPHAKGDLRKISDKTVMAQIAEEVGLHVPKTVMVELNDGATCPIDFPVIIKPYAGYAGRKTDIQICRSADEFESSTEYLRHNGYSKVMIQSLLESRDLQDLCLMGCSFDDGTVVIPCTIRKIRSYPLKQGSLSFGHVDHSVLASEMSCLKNFVKKTGYVGIFDIDMMICNGKPYFIEINYRNGQNGYVSTASGYNIPANWFRGMQGKPIETEKPLAEKYYMDEHCDYKHVLEGNVTIHQWLKDLRMTSVFAMYCRGDQRPFLRQYIRFPERWKNKLKKMVRGGRND